MGLSNIQKNDMFHYSQIKNRLGNIHPGITTSLAHWDVSGSTVTGYHWPYGPALLLKTRNSEAKKMAQQPPFSVLRKKCH